MITSFTYAISRRLFSLISGMLKDFRKKALLNRFASFSNLRLRSRGFNKRRRLFLKTT